MKITYKIKFVPQKTFFPIKLTVKIIKFNFIL